MVILQLYPCQTLADWTYVQETDYIRCCSPMFASYVVESSLSESKSSLSESKSESKPESESSVSESESSSPYGN